MLVKQIFYCLFAIFGWLTTCCAGGLPYTYHEERLQPTIEGDVFFLMDKTGFLWGKNDKGELFRFDGFERKYFRPNPDDGSSICGYDPNWLYEDSNGRIWIFLFSCGLNRYDPVSGRFERIDDDLARAAGVSIRSLNTIREDKQGNILIGSQIGLFIYPASGEDIRFIPSLPEGGQVSMLTHTDDGVLWGILSRRFVFRIFKLEPGADTLKVILTIPRTKQLGRIKQFIPLGDDRFIISIGSPHFLFDAIEQTIIPYDDVPFREEVINSVYHNNDMLLLGTSGGKIFRYHPSGRSFELLHHYHIGQTAVGDASINSLVEGPEGVLWFSADKSYKLMPDKGIRFLASPCKSQWGCIPVKYKGYVFNFSAEEGLLTIRGGTQIAARFNQGFQPPLVHTLINSAEDQQGILWLITSNAIGGGTAHLYGYNENGQLVWDIYSKAEHDGAATHPLGPFMDIAIDRNDHLWISSWWSGLYRFEPQTGHIQNYRFDSDQPSGLKANALRALEADSRNKLWIGYHNHGIDRLDIEPDTLIRPVVTETYACTFPDLYITYMDEDQLGNIWIGTSAGLYRYTPGNGCFRRYSRADGLGHDTMHSMAEDHNGRWWVNTIAGTADYYNPSTDKFQNFSDFGGSFNADYAYVDSAGYFYALSTGNILTFHPDSIDLSQAPPELIITDLLIFNERVEPGTEDGVLAREMPFTDHFTLAYRQNVFSIRYSALEYLQADKIRFAYMLEGFDPDWQEVGSKREATYTNLSPGRYTFRLRCSKNFGPWTSRGPTLLIDILPPWYRTSFAYFFYSLLISGVLYSIYHYQKRRLQLQARLRYEHAEAERLKELDHVKTRLYTNITHDFRTPLTIILGMVEQIKNKPEKWFNEGLQMIRRNGTNLLRLVNQMLDLAKVEAGNLPLTMIQGDIVNYLQYIIESFHSYAETKNIQLHFECTQTAFLMDYDPEKLLNIISNLISNAIKFTPEGGYVYIRADVSESSAGLADGTITSSQMLRIRIRDTGIGIAKDQLPFVFDRFYQVHNGGGYHTEGTGIGLALSHELIKLLEGQIAVTSEPGKGSVFTVLLPVRQTAPLAEAPALDPVKEAYIPDAAISTGEIENDSAIGKREEKALILIIEDNHDVVRYLSSCLQDAYRLEVAYDGSSGVSKAIELIPDIIISDVMMPGMDGFEVCEKLKKDLLTSHIPLILLTARADISSRVEGLERGADAYLAKPFHKEELLVRLRNLIELRSRLQEHYRQIPLPEPGDEPAPAGEDAFLRQVQEILETHLDDEHFGVEALCKKLGVSRAQLYRKFSAVTGQSVGRYFRLLRLHKAKNLLLTTDLTISEIAFETGFKYPAYFSRAFKEEFGKSPSEMRK